MRCASCLSHHLGRKNRFATLSSAGSCRFVACNQSLSRHLRVVPLCRAVIAPNTRSLIFHFGCYRIMPLRNICPQWMGYDPEPVAFIDQHYAFEDIGIISKGFFDVFSAVNLQDIGVGKCAEGWKFSFRLGFAQKNRFYPGWAIIVALHFFSLKRSPPCRFYQNRRRILNGFQESMEFISIWLPAL